MASGRMFRDELGRLNALISAASDRVVLVVAGRVLDLSGAPVVARDRA
jgi:adenosylcobinamide kinase/adenosylcobinamide-phosphate guanylyltransferase